MGDFNSKRIMVAVDGSDASREALGCAVDLALALGCRLTVVTAIQTQLPGYRAGYFSFVDRHILKELRDFAVGVLDEARKTAEARGVALDPVSLEGEKDIWEQLADLVQQTPDAAFLVMGSYGHGVRERHILGSTTQRLITEIARRGLKVPVLVVP